MQTSHSEQDLHLAERIGRQIAGAIANAKLYADLRKTEKSFREGKELYSRLINAVPDAVLFTDTTGHITFANNITLQRGGNTDIGEIVGKDLREYLSPEENKEEAVGRVMLMLTQKQGPQVFSCLFDTGRTMIVEVNADVLRNEDGSPFGAVFVCRDITERKKMEDQLRHLLETLEERIKTRTIELEETNTALRVLLRKGELDLNQKDHDFMDNINQLVMPFLQKLQLSNTVEQQRSYGRIIASNLKSITTPLLNKVSGSYRSLTPTETQIVTMVRNGMSSKEIAETMNVSIGTIVTHRHNVRKKLNLKSRGANLRSHLLSLTR